MNSFTKMMGLGIGFVLLTGCNSVTDQEPKENVAASSPASSKLVQMQNHNVVSAEETAVVPYDEEARQALKETLNLTFQIISAMQKNDSAYIKSVSAKDVQIDASEQNIIVDGYERHFLQGISLSNLQYRFYFPRNPNQIELAFTITNNHEVPDYDVVFEYIRGENAQWLYHGHLVQ